MAYLDGGRVEGTQESRLDWNPLPRVRLYLIEWVNFYSVEGGHCN